jgi:Ca-activated chloride channel homolog
MFSFAHIEYLFLLALLIPAFLLFFFNKRWKKKTVTKIGDAQLVQQLTSNHSPKKFNTKFWLLFFALAFTALGAANLRLPGESENVTRKGRDIVIAMDVSKSMLADDIKPSRLEKAKQFVSKLIDALPDDRIGLVWFAGKAYVPMPLTADEGAAKMFVQSANPDDIPTQGTVIGEALSLSAESFPKESKRYKIIVLITDGEDHDENAAEQALRLKEQGILLLTIGLGTEEGSTITDPLTNDFKKDKMGQTVISKLNEELLKKMALANGGMYGNLQNTDAMVNDVSAVINQLEKKSAEGNGTPANYIHLFMCFLLAALLFLIIEFFITEKKKV